MGPGAFGEIEPNRMKMKWGSKTIKISNLKAKMEDILKSNKEEKGKKHNWQCVDWAESKEIEFQEIFRILSCFVD